MLLLSKKPYHVLAGICLDAFGRACHFLSSKPSFLSTLLRIFEASYFWRCLAALKIKCPLVNKFGNQTIVKCLGKHNWKGTMTRWPYALVKIKRKYSLPLPGCNFICQGTVLTAYWRLNYSPLRSAWLGAHLHNTTNTNSMWWSCYHQLKFKHFLKCEILIMKILREGVLKSSVQNNTSKIVRKRSLTTFKYWRGSVWVFYSVLNITKANSATANWRNWHSKVQGSQSTFKYLSIIWKSKGKYTFYK